jgi:hypothetical protein
MGGDRDPTARQCARRRWFHRITAPPPNARRWAGSAPQSGRHVVATALPGRRTGRSRQRFARDGPSLGPDLRSPVCQRCGRRTPRYSSPERHPIRGPQLGFGIPHQAGVWDTVRAPTSSFDTGGAVAPREATVAKTCNSFGINGVDCISRDWISCAARLLSVVGERPLNIARGSSEHCLAGGDRGVWGYTLGMHGLCGLRNSVRSHSNCYDRFPTSRLFSASAARGVANPKLRGFRAGPRRRRHFRELVLRANRFHSVCASFLGPGRVGGSGDCTTKSCPEHVRGPWGESIIVNRACTRRGRRKGTARNRQS